MNNNVYYQYENYNSNNYNNNYTKNFNNIEYYKYYIYNFLKNFNKQETTKVVTREIIVKKEEEDKNVKNDYENNIIEKIKVFESKLLAEFQGEMAALSSTNDDVNVKTNKAIDKIEYYVHKIVSNRIKHGFGKNYVPVVFDIKTETYVTKVQETYIRTKKETAIKTINQLEVDFFDYLKGIAAKNIYNNTVKENLKNAIPNKLQGNKIVSLIPNANVVFVPKQKTGFYTEKRELFLNVCSVPKIDVKLKDNGERWELEETLNILKDKYRRLYVLFRNLFREDNNIEYMLNKFSYMLNDYEKWRTAEVVFGVQGAGKGVFAEYFVKRIVGDNNFLTISNSELQQDFNGFLENKLFIVANEVAGNITKNNVINNYLKALITDPYLIINSKNIKQYQAPNLFNLIIFSNSQEPVKVESTDRRFNVFKTANKDLKDVVMEQFNEDMEQYLSKLAKEIDEFLPILKATKFNKSLANVVINNTYRQKLKFATNNKISLLKDLVLKESWGELDSFINFIRGESDIEDDFVEIELRDNKKVINIGEEQINKILEQLKNGGFLTREQAETLVTVMYYKDIAEKGNALNDKVNKLNKAFNLLVRVKINGKTTNVRTCQEAEYFLEPKKVIILNNIYTVACIDLEKEKLKFKKIGEMKQQLKTIDPQDI